METEPGSGPQPRQAAVLGGSTMGASIGAYLLDGGWTVHAYSPSESTRRSLKARTAAHLRQASNTAAMQVHDRLHGLPWKDIALVIETVKEDLAVKQKLFAQVERLAHRDAVFATNTSGILVSEIYAGLEAADRMTGLHHFMPAHLVPLVEIVAAPGTSPAAVAKLKQGMEELGKIPVVCKVELPGLIANRIQHALMREALHLVSEGIASAEDVDKAVRYGFGFRYVAAGPLLQKELSGWDVNHDAAAAIYPSLCNDGTPNPLVSRLLREGRKGIKTKHGLWKWNPDQFEVVVGQCTKALTGALAILDADRQV